MGQQGGGNDKAGMNNMVNKPDNNTTTTDNSNSTNTDSFTAPSNNTSENASAPMNNSPGNMGGNSSNLDPTVMMQAMQIIQSSEDGTITDSIKDELLNLGLTEDDILNFHLWNFLTKIVICKILKIII